MYRVPNELIEIFAALIDDKQTVRYIAEQAGLPLGMIDLNGPPKVIWLNVLKEARKHEMLKQLLHTASREYPSANWKNIEQFLDQTDDDGAVSAPSIDEGEWRGRSSRVELEKLTGKEATFLPLHFLEQGMVKAKSVAKVKVENGAGTGFLTQDNLLITNNHVIGSELEAKKASVVFNYQHKLDGSMSETKTFTLKPELGFSTSKQHDWTAVRVDGDANAEWGMIQISDRKVKEGDYVNIIQHPSGNAKVIALYHNVVVFSDEDRVQYLTDTLPGSSGSPVFHSDWSLIALHHAGGNLAKDGSVRNQGISVQRLFKDLRAEGLI